MELLTASKTFAQQRESLLPHQAKHIPQKATLKSAVLPGWGQVYNQQYWKLPIVATAITIPTITYLWNNKQHKIATTAYKQVYESVAADDRVPDDVIKKLPQRYQDTYTSYLKKPATARMNLLYGLQHERRYYRQNRDLSLIWLAIMWSLNVVDATVSGHLKNFDVTDNLSILLQSQSSTSPAPFISIVIAKRWK